MCVLATHVAQWFEKQLLYNTLLGSYIDEENGANGTNNIDNELTQILCRYEFVSIIVLSFIYSIVHFV